MNVIEQLQKIKTFFTLEGASTMACIEQVGIDKWQANHKEVEAECKRMKDALGEGECDRHIHSYAKRVGWGKGDMLEWLHQEFGPLATLCVLMNGYNYQVCNGGHDQYIANDYASGNWQGFCGANDEMDAHNELIELVEKYGEIPLQHEVLKVLKSIELVERMYSCDDCGGAGEHEIHDEDGDYEDTERCITCDGDGETSDGYTVHQNEKRDDEWYAINEQAGDQFEAFFAKYVY